MEGQQVPRSTEFKLNITVVNPGSGNKYYIDGILQSYITLFPGCTYEFDQSDSSNNTHNLAFATLPDGADSSQYTTGVTTSGTPGNSGAYAKIEVTTSTPTRLYYYCTNHSGMGNQITCQTGTHVRAFQGGSYPGLSNQIQVTDMASTGKMADFGNLQAGAYAKGVCGNSIKGLFGGGSPDGGTTRLNTIDQMIVSSFGNTIDYGDLSVARHYVVAISNDTRAIWGGGYSGSTTNVIDFKLFSSSGNCTDFGDLTVARHDAGGSSSTTRGLFVGGTPTSDVIDYITIASEGNATDFGNLTVGRVGCATGASATRSVSGGGSTPSISNVIDYVTIASTGNATDFGDLSQARKSPVLSSSNKTMVLFGGGSTPSVVNTIDFVTISSTGNATDWGDLLAASHLQQSSSSNGHGGLA